MLGLANVAMTIAFLGWIACYFYIVIKTLAEGDQLPALAGALGFFVCGLGSIFAFAWGWYRAQKFRIFPWMIVWSVCWAALIVGSIAKAALEA